MDYSGLLSTIKTIEGRNRLYSEIEVVSAAIYKEGELAKVLENQISNTLQEYVGHENSKEIISQKLSNLKKNLDELVVLKLTLAIEPAQSTIEKLVGFIRENLEGKAILEFSYDPAILGGVVLEYKGLYRDHTLKTKLDDVFRNKQEEILEGLTQNYNSNVKSDLT